MICALSRNSFSLHFFLISNEGLLGIIGDWGRNNDAGWWSRCCFLNLRIALNRLDHLFTSNSKSLKMILLYTKQRFLKNNASFMKPSFYFFRKGLICIYERKNVRLFSLSLPLSQNLVKTSLRFLVTVCRIKPQPLPCLLLLNTNSG